MIASQMRVVSRASRKVGPAGVPAVERGDEVGHGVHEGVLVADDQAGHPPLAEIGVVAVGDEDRAPAAQRALGAVVEPGEAVEVVQIPGERAVLAVDLERVERLVAAGVAGGLKVPSAPLAKRVSTAAASSMPTGAGLPVAAWVRSLTKVSVIALRLATGR